MKHIGDLYTKEDVMDCSCEDLFEIDKEMMKYHLDFNNQEVSDEFAYQWVLRMPI